MFGNANNEGTTVSAEDARNIKKNVVSLGIMIVAILSPAMLFSRIYGDMPFKALSYLLIATAVGSTILLYLNFKLNSEKKAEKIWESVFFYSFTAGAISLVLTVSGYLPALASFTFFWSIWLGSWLSGGIHAADQDRN
jgi:hypothetical protein